MCLDGIATREHERVDIAHGEDIREEPPVQFREIDAAVWASGVSSSKASSQTSRMSRLISVRRTGHIATSSSRFR
ncbi:hypothetical protein GCM10010272_10660 [Streptomyces lateritius]|nr:hypothetical protein GCM10010272_10660 [Streptomyces lateritius]